MKHLRSVSQHKPIEALMYQTPVLTIVEVILKPAARLAKNVLSDKMPGAETT